MEINKEKYLEKFKIPERVNLFGMDWEAFNKEGRCPICTLRLKVMRNRPLRYCANKGHKKFICKKK